MAEKLLIMGESGTGKSTSLRNCDPETTAVVNPVGKPLPFKGSNRFTMLNGETDSRKICRFMKEQAAAGKKLLVVDDFQYILAVPYMERIKESGWDKYNDFGSNYFSIIQVCNELPADVVVAYLSHQETLDSGVTTVKLIGKLLREKITIEGLFTVVLRTGVNEGEYYFFTQNSGKDTVKSPMGMFPAYAIENDLNYVADKIRNYYEVGEFKTDAEMGQADAHAASDLEKPDANGRRARAKKPAAGRKTHDEVVAENNQKVAEYMEACDEAVDAAAGGRDGIPYDEACAAMDPVSKPELETPPRRTRKERKAAEAVLDGTENVDSETVVLDADTYFYVPADDNYVVRHKGDAVDLVVGGAEVMKVISKEEYGEGVKRLAQAGNVAEAPEQAAEPQTGRTRRVRKTR